MAENGSVAEGSYCHPHLHYNLIIIIFGSKTYCIASVLLDLYSFLSLFQNVYSGIFSNSKTRDLSDKSKQENVKTQKICRASLSSSDDNKHVFTERSDSYVPLKILYICLSNLETKVKDIFDVAIQPEKARLKM